MKPYRPSSGTEAADFQAAWCDQCQRDAVYRLTGSGSCEVLMQAIVKGTAPQWVVREEGPICTLYLEDVQCG